MTSKKFLFYSIIILFIFTFSVSESIPNGSAIFGGDDESSEEWGLIAEFMELENVGNTTIHSMFLLTETPESEHFVLLFNFSFFIELDEGYTVNYTVSLNLICKLENNTVIWIKNWNKTTIDDLQRNITGSFSFISPKRLEVADVILTTNSTIPHLIHASYDRINEYTIEPYFTENSIDYYHTVFIYYEDWVYNFSFHTIWNNHTIPIMDQNVLITVEQVGTPSLLNNFSMNITLGYLNFKNATDIENSNLASDCLVNWTKQENYQCSFSTDESFIPETFQPSLADLQIRSGFTFHFGDGEINVYIPLTNEPNFLPLSLHPFVYVAIGISIGLALMITPSIYRAIKKRK